MIIVAVFDPSPPGQDADDVLTVRPPQDGQRDSFLGVIGRHRSPSISVDHSNPPPAAAEALPVSPGLIIHTNRRAG